MRDTGDDDWPPPDWPDAQLTAVVLHRLFPELLE
jgi:hypothetical protein